MCDLANVEPRKTSTQVKAISSISRPVEVGKTSTPVKRTASHHHFPALERGNLHIGGDGQWFAVGLLSLRPTSTPVETILSWSPFRGWQMDNLHASGD